MEWTKTKIAGYAAAIAVFLGLVYTADFKQMVTAVRQADLQYVAVAAGLGTVTLLVWSTVWHRFFAVMGFQETWLETVQVFAAAEFLNNVTPFGQAGGQPFMAYVIAAHNDAEYEEALATVVAADMVTAIPIVTFVSASVLYLAATSALTAAIVGLVAKLAVVMAGVAVAAAVVWTRYVSLRGLATRLLGRLTGAVDAALLDRVEAGIETVSASVGRLRRQRRALVAPVVIAHGGFVTRVGMLAALMHGLGYAPVIPYLVVIVPVAAVAKTSPLPGGTGGYEAVMAGLIALLFPVPVAAATVIAVLFRLCGYWQNIVLGYLCLWTLGGIKRPAADALSSS